MTFFMDGTAKPTRYKLLLHNRNVWLCKKVAEILQPKSTHALRVVWRWTRRYNNMQIQCYEIKYCLFVCLYNTATPTCTHPRSPWSSTQMSSSSKFLYEIFIIFLGSMFCTISHCTERLPLNRTSIRQNKCAARTARETSKYKINSLVLQRICNN